MTSAVSTFSAPIANAMIDTANDTASRMAKFRSLLSTSLVVDAVRLPSPSIDDRCVIGDADHPKGLAKKLQFVAKLFAQRGGCRFAEHGNVAFAWARHPPLAQRHLL